MPWFCLRPPRRRRRRDAGRHLRRSVQFTPHGPVAMHVVIGPRPTGLCPPPGSFERVDPGRREGHRDAEAARGHRDDGGNQRRLLRSDTGRPTGVDAARRHRRQPPSADRSSVGVSTRGQRDIRRVQLFGTWRGLGQRRTLTDLNQAPAQNAISLFTPSYGLTTPAQAGVTEMVIQPFPPATANTDLVGPVVQFLGRRRLDHPPRRGRARRAWYGG